MTFALGGNPANNELVGTIPAAGIGDAQRALDAARNAFPTWSRISIAERQQWMHKLRDAVIANEEHLHDFRYNEILFRADGKK